MWSLSSSVCSFYSSAGIGATLASRDGRATELGFARARRLMSGRSRIYPTWAERIEGGPPSVRHACASTSRECALISPAISLRWALRRGWRRGRLAGDMRSRIGPSSEHRECRQAAVQGKHQSALLNLTHLPPVNIVADAHPPYLAARSCLHHRARILVIHHDAK